MGFKANESALRRTVEHLKTGIESALRRTVEHLKKGIERAHEER